MENELLELQNKISKLENKLSVNQQLTLTQSNTQGSIERNDGHDSTKTNSRLDVNLDTHLNVKEINNSSFCSEKVNENIHKVQTGRRSESVALTNRCNYPKVKANLSASKNSLNNSVGRKPRTSSTKPKSRILKNREISETNSRLQSSSKKRTNFKSYMRPTEVSNKKSTRSKVSNSLQYRAGKHDHSKQNLTTQTLLMFFNNLKMRRDDYLHQARHNKTVKYLFFMFSPQIITLMLMFKMYMVSV
jgi:hypothetical protein